MCVCVNDDIQKEIAGTGDCRAEETDKGTWITKGKQDAFKHLIFLSVLILLLIILRHRENGESLFARPRLSRMLFVFSMTCGIDQ